MKHTRHIEKNKATLLTRAAIIRYIREFFWDQGFSEVETPLILHVPGQEPYLSPMKVEIKNERNEPHHGYLHTSPEYTMKKMLAAGFDNIFSICKCFRNKESFGGTHNPEFTMIEWYRKDRDFTAIMDDCEQLFQYISTKLNVVPIAFQRRSMNEVWQQTIKVNLDNHLTQPTMKALCETKGYQTTDNEPYEDLFYKIFLNEIEPKLKGAQIIHHYPAQMAALARLSDDDPCYAERFELYVNGIELANAFSELCDPEEQRKRLEEEREQRKAMRKDVFDIDEEFVNCLEHIESAAGIALGVDRLVQVFTGCHEIDDVLSLPASKLFTK